MTPRSPIRSIMMAAGLAMACVASRPATAAEPAAPPAAEPGITLAAAIAVVEKTFPAAAVIEAELDRFDGQPAYEITFLLDKAVHKAVVRKADGEIVKTSRGDDRKNDDEEDDDDDDEHDDKE